MKNLDLKTLLDHLQKIEDGISALSNLTDDIKGILAGMISAIYDVYSQIVKVLNPLYDITDETSFHKHFNDFRDNFRREFVDEKTGNVDYLKLGDLHISCRKVNYALEKVSTDERIGNKKILEAINTERTLWFQDDTKGDLDLFKFFEDLNKELATISSYSDLQTFLSNSRPYFDTIRKKLEPYSSKKSEFDTFVKTSILGFKSNSKSRVKWPWG